MPSIRQRLGDWGKRIIGVAQAGGRTLGETLGILQPIAPEIEPVAAARDWGKVSLELALAPEIAKLPDDAWVQHGDYVEMEVPWKMRYGYEVSVYGREIASGKFRSWQVKIGTNTELDIGQVKTEAMDRLGPQGISPLMDIWSMEVTGAYHSPEAAF